MNTLLEKSSVWQTSMDALDYCWRNRGRAERYGLIPALLSIAAGWALLFFQISPTEPSGPVYANLVFQMVIFLPPTVAWYRTLVYGEDAAHRPMFALTPIEGRLLAWQVLVTVLLAVAAGIGAVVIAVIAFGIRSIAGDVGAIVVAAPLGAAAFVYFIMIATRLSMVCALATLDTPVALGIAWEMTKPIAWRLTGAVLIVSLAAVLFGAMAELVAWIVGALIATVRGSEISHAVDYVRVVAQAPTGLLWLFAVATLLGSVYKARVETKPAPMDPPAPV